MTPEQLESLVLHSDKTSKLQAAFAALSEKERKALSTSAGRLRNQICRGKANDDASDELKQYLKKRGTNHWNSSVYNNATIAVFALCPVSQLKKNDIFVWNNGDVLQQVILDRKPDWLDDWLEYDLAREFPTTGFSMLRSWIRAGICRKPSSVGYVRKFAGELMALQHRKDLPPNPPISERLLAEPDMLEDVWQLFEVENQAFNTESWLTSNAPANYETWPEALIKLSNNGHLDRQRLLDSSLHGLLLDIKQNQLAGFHKFHVKLTPNREELLARQSDYLALLSHPVGHVVKFALGIAGQMEKLRILDADTFLAEVTAVFMHEVKGNAIAALKLIHRIIKKQPEYVAAGLTAAIEGLKHANIDVQTAGLDVLEGNQSGMTDNHRKALENSLNFVAAASKPGISNLLGDDIAPTAEIPADEDVGRQALEQVLASLTVHEKKALGLDGVAPDNSPGFLPPIAPDILQHRLLPTLEPVQAIVDLDDLIITVSHAVEVVDDSELVERILDGISRLCDQRPDDFNDRVAPLLNRLQSGGGLATQNGIAGGYGGIRLVLADLLLTWLTGKFYKTPDSQYFSQSDTLVPMVTRVRDITLRVLRQQPQQLIGTPTHAGGWIDPVIWTERIISCEQNRVAFDRMDFCLSFLRLTPDNRQQARAQLPRLSGKVKRVVDFALGGDVAPEPEERKDYDIWIAAARGRDPNANWAETFQSLKLKDAWPDSVTPAIYHWKAYTAKRNGYKLPGMDIEIASQAQASQPQDRGASTVNSLIGKLGKVLDLHTATDWERLPSVALNKRSVLKYSWAADINTTWIAQWLACQWPLKPEPVYLQGVDQMVRRIDMDSSNWEPCHGFFHGLFERRRPWQEPAHLLLCTGLAGKNADTRGLAIDALIEGIEYGHADVKLLADILTRLSDGGWLKLNRLSENLLQVAQVSGVHAWAMSELIQGWCLHSSLQQNNIARMLEVLLEVQAMIKQPLHDNCLSALAALTGSSKAAKLAKQLRELQYTDPAFMEDLKRRAITTRVAHYRTD